VLVLFVSVAYYNQFFFRSSVPCPIIHQDQDQDQGKDVNDNNETTVKDNNKTTVNEIVKPEVRDEYNEPTSIDKWVKSYKTGPGFDRWKAYFYPYERHFAPWRGKNVVLLEIGVQSGGSTRMWPKFFGPGLIYHGVDINPNCKQYEKPNITIHLADQSDRNQLIELMKKIPVPDIIIDDGGHAMNQQINSFEVLFPYLKSPGVYLCEDLHTSYWEAYGGSAELKGVTKPTMIEYSKSIIDIINLEHVNNPSARNNEQWKALNLQIGGVTFYDSMVFIEKTKKPNFDRVRVGDFIPY